MILNTTAVIEVSTDSGITPKDAYKLRRRLEEVFEETLNSVLAEFDVANQLEHGVRVDDVEVDGEETGE